MTQLLKRLNRNINHIKSNDWDTSGRVMLINWDDIQWGDIIMWDHGHVAIFIKWRNRNADPPTVDTWEARGGDFSVGLQLGRPLRDFDDAHPYTWVENVIFKNCE